MDIGEWISAVAVVSGNGWEGFFISIYMFISTFVLYKIRIALSLKISTGWRLDTGQYSYHSRGPVGLDSIRTTPEDQ